MSERAFFVANPEPGEILALIDAGGTFALGGKQRRPDPSSGLEELHQQLQSLLAVEGAQA
jgi:hypothetical protein